jgi:hypothetical protein
LTESEPVRNTGADSGHARICGHVDVHSSFVGREVVSVPDEFISREVDPDAEGFGESAAYRFVRVEGVGAAVADADSGLDDGVFGRSVVEGDRVGARLKCKRDIFQRGFHGRA